MQTYQKPIRCRNSNLHRRGTGQGNLLLVLDKDAIYVQCSDKGCRRFTRLRLIIPGVKIDFRQIGIKQQVMRKGLKFNFVPTSVVVEGPEED